MDLYRYYWNESWYKKYNIDNIIKNPSISHNYNIDIINKTYKLYG